MGLPAATSTPRGHNVVAHRLLLRTLTATSLCFASPVAALSSSAWEASGNQGGVAQASSPAKTLDDVVVRVGDAASSAKAAAVAARTVAAEVRTRMTAEQAEAASLDTLSDANEAVTEVQQARKDLRGSMLAAQGAAAAAESAKEALQQTEKYAQEVEANAEADAAKAVRKRLGGLMREFEEWKIKLLHDPRKEALEAGALAAKPYHAMAQHLASKAANSKLDALWLGGKVHILEGGARYLAEDAETLRRAGHHSKADKIDMRAQNLADQAKELKHEGYDIQADIEEFKAQIPEYEKAADYAAMQAAHSVAPKFYGPPRYMSLPTLPN